jgi:hypothetical protein
LLQLRTAHDSVTVLTPQSHGLALVSSGERIDRGELAKLMTFPVGEMEWNLLLLEADWTHTVIAAPTMSVSTTDYVGGPFLLPEHDFAAGSPTS